MPNDDSRETRRTHIGSPRLQRRETRTTTEDVASHMGISRALLYRYECGDIV